MKIALAQFNPTVGDLEGNKNRILEFVSRARREDAELVVFPELALTGYPPRDLLERESFLRAARNTLKELAVQVSDLPVLLGTVTRNPHDVGKPIYNSAVLLRDHKIETAVHKVLLPNYDVFSEKRHFEPGPPAKPIEINGRSIGVVICEDMWNDREFWDRPLYSRDPVEEIFAAGSPECILGISASPWNLRKERFRLELTEAMAKKYGVPVISVNQVGANDELIFDGHSLAVSADGTLLGLGAGFDEDLVMIDLAQSTGNRSTQGSNVDEENLRRALVLGVKDYFRKCGFDSAIIGLSGGIDSALTAAIAVEALGAEHLRGIAMPSRFSSKESVEDAEALASNLGIVFDQVSIDAIFETYLQEMRPAYGRAGDEKPERMTVAEENIQARIRGNILMAYSNRFGSIVLSTGNKSELAVGYCTLYGDMAGGMAVISDVPKTMVYRLARHINAESGTERIPERTITKPPSAELRQDQKDTDSLPEYDVLDAILQGIVENHEPLAAIIARGYDADVVERIAKMVARTEYKRRQAAPGLKVTSKAFGAGRQLPIAQGWEEPL